jgi:hypothetical protein
MVPPAPFEVSSVALNEGMPSTTVAIIAFLSIPAPSLASKVRTNVNRYAFVAAKAALPHFRATLCPALRQMPANGA